MSIQNHLSRSLLFKILTLMTFFPIFAQAQYGETRNPTQDRWDFERIVMDKISGSAMTWQYTGDKVDAGGTHLTYLVPKTVDQSTIYITLKIYNLPEFRKMVDTYGLPSLKSGGGYYFDKYEHHQAAELAKETGWVIRGNHSSTGLYFLVESDNGFLIVDSVSELRKRVTTSSIHRKGKPLISTEMEIYYPEHEAGIAKEISTRLEMNLTLENGPTGTKCVFSDKQDPKVFFTTKNNAESVLNFLDTYLSRSPSHSIKAFKNLYLRADKFHAAAELESRINAKLVATEFKDGKIVFQFAKDYSLILETTTPIQILNKYINGYQADFENGQPRWQRRTRSSNMCRIVVQ